MATQPSGASLVGGEAGYPSHVRAVAVCAIVLLNACGAVGERPLTASAAPPSAVSAVSSAVERGPSDFTGEYMVDSRPIWMGWLSLTQTGKSVSGALTLAEPDGKGSTKATTHSVSGAIDGDSLSLTTGMILGTVGMTFTGRRSNESVTLTYPSKTGELQAAPFRRASQAAFNEALAAWQQQLASAYADAERAAAAAKALAHRNASLAQVVKDRGADLRSAIAAVRTQTQRLNEQLADATTYSGRAQTAIKTLQSDLARVQRSASGTLDQYRACQTVRYDYEQSMGYTYNQTLGYERRQFANTVKELDTALGAVDARIASTERAATALVAAIANSPLRVDGTPAPGDEKQPIQAYRTTAATVAKELDTLRRLDITVLNAAQGLMGEGGAIWTRVKTAHKCA